MKPIRCESKNRKEKKKKKFSLFITSRKKKIRRKFVYFSRTNRESDAQNYKSVVAIFAMRFNYARAQRVIKITDFMLNLTLTMNYEGDFYFLHGQSRKKTTLRRSRDLCWLPDDVDGVDAVAFCHEKC